MCSVVTTLRDRVNLRTGPTDKASKLRQVGTLKTLGVSSLDGDADNRDEDGNVEAGDDANDGADEGKDGDGEATNDTVDGGEEQGEEGAEDVAIQSSVLVTNSVGKRSERRTRRRRGEEG